MFVGSSVQVIRNSLGTMSDTITFVNASAKRLDAFLRQTSEKNSRTRLVRLCETRWVEKHEAVLRFCDHYPDIISVSFIFPCH